MRSASDSWPERRLRAQRRQGCRVGCGTLLAQPLPDAATARCDDFGLSAYATWEGCSVSRTEETHPSRAGTESAAKPGLWPAGRRVRAATGRRRCRNGSSVSSPCRVRPSSGCTARGRARRGLPAGLGRSGRVPFHPGHSPDHVPGPPVDHAAVRRLRHRRGDQPSGSATCLANGQTGLSVAFDLPTLMGYDSDSPWADGEVGVEGVAVSSSGRHGDVVRRHPAGPGDHVHDHQLAGHHHFRHVLGRRREAGRSLRKTVAVRSKTTS